VSIAKRVETALDFISKGDFENALIYISIVVDATSKKESPRSMSQSNRNKKFIDDNQDFVYRFSTGGQVSVTGTLNYPTGTLGRTLYKIIRCGLLHEGILPDTFVMLDGQGLGFMRTNIDQDKPMGFAISTYLLVALLILVITSPVNRRESINGGMDFTIYDITSQVNNIWGDRSHLNSYPIYD
jgi:hypothetical protein